MINATAFPAGHLIISSSRHQPTALVWRDVVFLYRGLDGCVLEFIMLSAREREVMLLVGKGLSNRDIGRRLEISDGTVKVHLQHIYRKPRISNRTMLAVLAADPESARHLIRSRICPALPDLISTLI